MLAAWLYPLMASAPPKTNKPLPVHVSDDENFCVGAGDSGRSSQPTDSSVRDSSSGPSDEPLWHDVSPPNTNVPHSVVTDEASHLASFSVGPDAQESMTGS